MPTTTEAIDQALSQLENRLAEVRIQAAAAAPEAAPDELTERQRLFQQWVLALDAQSRDLRRLKEVRRLKQDRSAEAQSWTGFTETPPYPLALVEGLRDAIAAQQLESQTDQMMLSISESGVLRYGAAVEASRKLHRLARDEAERDGASDQRSQWLLRLAELRVQSSEALLEASDKSRLVTLEHLAAIRHYIDFLNRKFAAARVNGRFDKQDLDIVLAQLNTKGEELRQELNDAIAGDAASRRALAVNREDLSRAQSSGAPADKLRNLRATVEAAQARVETGEFKVDLLRLFLFFRDCGQAIWEARFWAAGDRSVSELRNKQKAHRETLDRLLPWKNFAELKLAATASLALTESIRASATNLTAVEQESSRQIQAAMEERAALYQRAVSAISLVQSASERLLADLDERENSASIASKGRFIVDGAASFFRRIWNTELYIAEDSVIADGQKITVPRIITIGKITIALAIFLIGLIMARWGRGVARQTASQFFGAAERSSTIAAKVVSGLVVIVAIIVAMASVRIPWTIFAFMGGALAIGIGFGAQNLINNFISGVILLFERSIRVDDIVEVGDQRGKVIRVGFRNSLIKRGDGVEVLVPNSKFLETSVVNWTLTDDLVRDKVTVGAAYGTPLKQILPLIAQAAAEHANIVKDPPPQVLLEDFGDNALIFELVFWIQLLPGVDGAAIRSDLRLRIHQLFDQAGIVLAFPQRDVHLDSSQPLSVRLIETEKKPE